MQKNTRKLVLIRKIYRFMALVFLGSFFFLAAIIDYIYYIQNMRATINYADSAVKGICAIMTEEEDSVLTFITDNYETYYRNHEGLAWVLEMEDHTGYEYTSLLYQGLSAFFSMNSDVQEVSIYVPEDEKIYSISNYRAKKTDTETEKYTDLISCYENNSFHLSAEPTAYNAGSGPNYVYCLKDPIIHNNTGAIRFTFSQEMVRRNFAEKYPQTAGSYYVINENNEILFRTENGQDLTSMPESALQAETKTYIKIGGKRYYIIKDSLSNPDMQVICLIPFTLLISGVISSLIAVVLIMGFSIFFAYSMLRRYIKNNTLQLDYIYEAMQSTAQGELSTEITVIEDQESELADIARAYNQMLRRLNEYIDKAYRMELSNEQHKLMLLQSQINPHFLYNALENIRMKAFIENKPEIAEMVFILSKILRNSIKGDGILSIRQEADNCRDYLRLCEMLYKGRFAYEMDIDPGLKNKKIIQHTLLVAAENFIMHGFDPESSGNHLAITGRLQNDTVLFTVKDNGTGITPEALQELVSSFEDETISKKKSLGLRNIYQRMKLLYRDQFDFVIESEPGNGTEVNFSYPAEEIRYDQSNPY